MNLQYKYQINNYNYNLYLMKALLRHNLRLQLWLRKNATDGKVARRQAQCWSTSSAIEELN